MKFPKAVDLRFAPFNLYVRSHIVELTSDLIERSMGKAWWDNADIDPTLAEAEIDRHWDWSEMGIELNGRVLGSRKLAIVTDDGAVQGAAMCSTEKVASTLEPKQFASFVELLFTAPRNRVRLRTDGREQFKGVGYHLLVCMAEISDELGFGGRLKLDSSPEFVDWYERFGLRRTLETPILFEGVEYTPMELTFEAAHRLLAPSA
jgi:hypothetical protein